MLVGLHPPQMERQQEGVRLEARLATARHPQRWLYPARVAAKASRRPVEVAQAAPGEAAGFGLLVLIPVEAGQKARR